MLHCQGGIVLPRERLIKGNDQWVIICGIRYLSQ
jgi:hypothetical protein